MRLRSIVFLLLLGLSAGASAVTAAESRATAAQRGGGVSVQEPLGFLGKIGTYLVTVWSGAGCRIDPLGLCSADSSGNGWQPVSNRTSGHSGG